MLEDREPEIERLLATLRGEPADRVPNFEILIEDVHVEQLLGRKAGNTLEVGGDPAKGSQACEGTRPMHPLDYLELCRKIGQDAIALECLLTPIRQRKPDGSVALLNDRSFKGPTDLKRVIWPDDEDVERVLGYVREYVEAAAAGIDVFYPPDDFAYNKGLFVEPRRFERLWRPHYDHILAPAREAKVPIWFDSDGKIDQAVEMLLDMGVDCLTPMGPSGIDYRDYKKRCGHRVTLHGNMDISWPLVNRTSEDVVKMSKPTWIA